MGEGWNLSICMFQHFMRKLAAVIIIGMKHNLEQTLKYHRLYVPKNITTPLTKIYAWTLQSTCSWEIITTQSTTSNFEECFILVILYIKHFAQQSNWDYHFLKSNLTNLMLVCITSEVWNISTSNWSAQTTFIALWNSEFKTGILIEML